MSSKSLSNNSSGYSSSSKSSTNAKNKGVLVHKASSSLKGPCHNNSSIFSTSSVKISSPLTKPWIPPDNNNADTIERKKILKKRWSTVSGSLIVRKKNKKNTASKLWLNRQKRRTFPPSSEILKQEQKRFILNVVRDSNRPENPVNDSNKPSPSVPYKYSNSRHNLAEILANFHNFDATNSSTLITPLDLNESSNPSTSSSSLSRRINKLFKNKGKQPYKKSARKELHVNTDEEFLKSAVIASIFKTPPTISSKSSATTSTPIQFPMPPKRFSAIHVDGKGNIEKTEYRRPKSRKRHRSNYFINLMIHGAPFDLARVHENDAILLLEKGKMIESREARIQRERYKRQLIIDTLLFLLGFVFFPCWWIGAFLGTRRKKKNDTMYETGDLLTVRTLAWLNLIFAFISIGLIMVIIALVIWLVKA